ncbi:MAG: VWA domain-containing protein [Planctomycetes bacterium]|nr:VWA domain-containing protein [Planctomycetota bacterium]
MIRDAAASVATALLLLGAVTLPFFGFGLLQGVGLAAPLGLSLGALALPLLLLYVLKSRRPLRRVGSVAFWRVVAAEQQATSPFKRLRRNLVLLLQLLVLASLAYALARPVVQADARDGVAHVIVLDTSASMLARDHGGRSRFDAARATALELVRSLGPRDHATVIAADRTAWTVVPWTSDPAALARGLWELAPRHTGTQLDDALILAASAARSGPGQPEVHLLSDGAFPPPPPVTLGAPLRFHAFGRTGENVGVIAVDVRPRAGPGPTTEGGALAWEVFASVRNAGEVERDVYLGLERHGLVVAARRVTVPPRSDRPVVIEARLPPGPLALRARGTDGRPLDVLPEDDVAWALIPEERGVPVGLVTAGESPALARALEAAGGLLRVMTPETYQDDPALRLYVFEGWVPAALPPRDCLVVNPGAAVGPVGVGDEVTRPRVAGWDRDDPLLEFVELDDVQVAATRPLELGPGARALVQADASGGPVVLVAAYQDGAATRTLVGFDLYGSTWPLRASFPIFARNAVVLAGLRDELARGGLRAGDPLTVPVAAHVTEVVLVRPDGRREAVPARDGQAYVAGTDQTGVYEVHAGDRVERFCVNLGAPEEVRIAPRATLELGDVLVTTQAASTRPTEVAPWFAGLAVLVLVVEAWAFHRRW